MKGISKYKNPSLIQLKSLIEDELSIKLDDDAFKEIMGKYFKLITPPSFCLTTKEITILKWRLNQYTLEKIGKRFFVSKENIRQGEAKALRKLMHPSRIKVFLKNMKEDE